MSSPDPKLPKNTRLVYEVVNAQVPGQHAAAQDIYLAARQRQPGLGVSTVYRALDRLCAAGLIHAVRVPGGASALYEPARTGHAHFQCSACGEVEDIDYDLPATDVARLNLRHGLRITGATLTFSGLCGDCARTGATTRSGGVGEGGPHQGAGAIHHHDVEGEAGA